MRVVVIDHRGQRRKAAIVIEAAFGVCPQAPQRSRTVTLVRRARSLEIVDAHFLGGMHVPAGLGEQRRYVAPAALRLGAEEGFTALRRRAVVAAARWSRRFQ